MHRIIYFVPNQENYVRYVYANQGQQGMRLGRRNLVRYGCSDFEQTLLIFLGFCCTRLSCSVQLRQPRALRVNACLSVDNAV